MMKGIEKCLGKLVGELIREMCWLSAQTKLAHLIHAPDCLIFFLETHAHTYISPWHARLKILPARSHPWRVRKLWVFFLLFFSPLVDLRMKKESREEPIGISRSFLARLIMCSSKPNEIADIPKAPRRTCQTDEYMWKRPYFLNNWLNKIIMTGLMSRKTWMRFEGIIKCFWMRRTR